MIANDGEREGRRVRDGHGRVSGRGARHARPQDRLRHLGQALACLVAFILLFAVTAGVLWLIAEVLPVWAAVLLTVCLLLAYCWFATDGY